MPELPEVETIKEAIRQTISGAIIESVEVYNHRLRQEIPQDLEKIAYKTHIANIYRRAKYIVIDLDNGYSLILHLGMSGRIKILSAQPLNLEKHDHVVIKTTKGVIIYNDARRFGLLTYCLTNKLEQNPLFTDLGFDPFDDKATGEYLFKTFKNKKTYIKLALLDQHILAGIGNIYASEALYEAKISPLRVCSTLTLKECSCLLEAVRLILKKAIAAGGSTLRDYKKPDGSLGYFQNQHCVYDKEGKRCPNCTCNLKKTGGIKKVVLGGRSSFYCDYLQK
ncbi:MAG: bifunctional DNA-formamidopyrimidine glycosylase/DNA-(apurinic or apyrimidinic site) lyase [Alphaproteobacteria bacterium]|nr:bifunctional DNA-formamidopyrimidine glycosylase/DNA-(apurinic or apyrimidinic site) lyase [Alphaproteobacteria bacterium]MBP3687137.1 bifunctional DNA-formamidopyrimidine glycosylase/DNA-(apurinic or apyrimidinic site) lyase [Alphaproteobacteria bacterium]